MASSEMQQRLRTRDTDESTVSERRSRCAGSIGVEIAIVRSARVEAVEKRLHALHHSSVRGTAH
jgi:hypothetical protein